MLYEGVLEKVYKYQGSLGLIAIEKSDREYVLSVPCRPSLSHASPLLLLLLLLLGALSKTRKAKARFRVHEIQATSARSGGI